MASRGAAAIGTDGLDFTHRQQVAEQYLISAKNKYRLKICIFLHYILFIAMMTKLSPDILDRLDIFILEIEELEVPKPHIWEYIWALSVVLTLFALSAMKKNRVSLMKKYMYGTALFSFLPALYGVMYYQPEVYMVLSKTNTHQIQMWKNLPYALICYIFLLPAIQVHFFSLYIANELITAWGSRGSKKD